MPAASVQLNGFVPAQARSEAREAPKPGLFTRFVRSLHDAQTRRAERVVARFIETRGGRMTDELERKIERHFI